jgi:hypothetical protein
MLKHAPKAACFLNLSTLFSALTFIPVESIYFVYNIYITVVCSRPCGYVNNLSITPVCMRMYRTLPIYAGFGTLDCLSHCG